MLRGLHAKLVMIMVLLILSLMTVIGVFLINSVMAFYLKDFYTQMRDVFSNVELYADLTTETQEEENGAQMICDTLLAYSGDLGVNRNRGDRNFYVLDGETGEYLAGTDDLGGAHLEYTENLLTALYRRESGDGRSITADYMDVAIPIQRGAQWYVIYIRDNKATVTSLTDELLPLIVEALLFGLVISVLLSFLLSKTMVAPLRRLKEGAERVAQGDFSRKIQVFSRDEIGVLTDSFNHMATQLRDTLRQVENERNKLGTLFLHMTDGVAAFSREGGLIHHNPAAQEMLGLPLGEDTHYEALFSDIAPLKQVLSAPDFLEGERQQGDRYLQLLLAPFDRQSQGGALVVIHDVTEQRRNEELRREFVANVSHELRTPLTNIRSYAETLAEEHQALPPDVERRFLGIILSESDRMTHIVQDLLTLSRFDSGRADLNLSRFSFRQALQDLCQAVYMEARRHNHTVTLDAPDDLPSVYADRERILQVMMNVLSNAIKYTPDGGLIRITAGRRRGWVWMVVDDNGIGIPSEDRSRIFERFYRVDKARSRQSGGTGLGLSIAREIAQQHGGSLRLEEKEGPGLAVRLELRIEGPDHG